MNIKELFENVLKWFLINLKKVFALILIQMEWEKMKKFQSLERKDQSEFVICSREFLRKIKMKSFKKRVNNYFS